MKSTFLKLAGFAFLANLVFSPGSFAQTATTTTSSCPPVSSTPSVAGASTADTADAQAAIANAQANGGYLANSTSVNAGNGEQCAALTQDLSPGIGATPSWQDAGAVSCSTPPGTPIATFLFNNGPGGSASYGPASCPAGCPGQNSTHTGIFDGCDSSGNMLLLNQSSGSPAHISTMSGGTCGTEQCMGSYGVIAGGTNAFGGAAATPATNPDGTPVTTPTTTAGTAGGTCSPQQAAANSSTGGALDPAAISAGIVSTLGSQCWGCQMYVKLLGTVNSLTSQAMTSIAGSGTMLAGLLFGIVLIWKVMKIIAMPVLQHEHELVHAYSDVWKYLGRITIVMAFFLSANAYSALSSTTSSFSSSGVTPIRDLFIDGPFTIGADIGCQVMNVASSALTSGLSSTGSSGSTTTSTGTAVSCPTGGTDWLSEHTSVANSILMAWHQMGVAGIALGVFLCTTILQVTFNPGTVSKVMLALSPDSLAKSIAIFSAGLAMSLTFLGFTVTFALRYIDALLRAMVALALMPVFLVMWVFDYTRPIAMAAFKAVLFMMTVFIASGLAYAFSNFFMQYAMGLAGVSGGSPLALAQVNLLNGQSTTSGFAALAESYIGIPTMNWGVYFGLMAGWMMAIAMPTIAFQLAEELLAFSSGGNNRMIGFGTEKIFDGAKQSIEGAGQKAPQLMLGFGKTAVKMGARAARMGGRAASGGAGLLRGDKP